MNTPWRRAPTGRASTLGAAGKVLMKRVLTEVYSSINVLSVPNNL